MTGVRLGGKSEMMWDCRAHKIPSVDGGFIEGEYIKPIEEKPKATVLLIHGSGPSDRHATVTAMGKVLSKNFDVLSESLLEQGYAVFRFDKKESYDIPVIIAHAKYVVSYVCSLSEVDSLYLYGWSEGVRVIAEILKDIKESEHASILKGAIMQSGIANGWSPYFSYILKELMLEKLKELDTNQDGILEVSDFEGFVPDATSVTFATCLMILDSNGGKIQFSKNLDKERKGQFHIEKDWMPLAEEIVKDPTTLIRFAENAPNETWNGILEEIHNAKIPMLVLHGMNDGWISPVEAVQIAKAGRNYADICLFKGLGHSLAKADSPLKDEGGVMEEEPVQKIIEWLDKQKK